jgi:regulator of cell morphogenesis and NO signaling
MTDCDLETSVPDWLIDHPEILPVLQDLGIDYSCGGKSLEFACQEVGLNVNSVLSSLRQAIEDASNR